MKASIGKPLAIAGIALAAIALALSGALYAITYHPPMIGEVAVANGAGAPVLERGKALKVLSWNVQYMAGKNYVFFYDLIDGSGPDSMPSRADAAATELEVARVIREENPDLILLQEVDDGAKRTYFEDQLASLRSLLSPEYSSWTSAYYWKAAFVPHPRIMGSVGMKLAVISKYRIGTAFRHQLPDMPGDPVTKAFNFRRAVLEARLPVKGSGELTVLVTHLDAFAQGSDTMERQVGVLGTMLERLDADGQDWLLAGDFNLLPPGSSWTRLQEGQRVYYKPESELEPFFAAWKSFPSLAEIEGPDRESFWTHYPNDPAVLGPDRTIDYIFHSGGFERLSARVRRADTMRISDHLPLVATLRIP